jgi:hypothetical protein
LTIDDREATLRADEMQPGLQESCPALALERRVPRLLDERALVRADGNSPSRPGTRWLAIPPRPT